MTYHPVVKYMSWLTVLCLFSLSTFWFACSEWDTDTIGTAFTPANSEVRAFTHPVYVEYLPSGVRCFGPYANEVQTSVDGLHVSLSTRADSLALFVYGYPAATDSLALSDASLSIESAHPFALYLNGSSLRRQGADPLLNLSSSAACHLVLPKSTQNTFYGSIRSAAEIIVSGTGALSVYADSTCLTAHSLLCQYAASLLFYSQRARGIALSGGFLKASSGTWRIDAYQEGILAQDSILLLSGSFRGSSATSAFLQAPKGIYVRKPTLVAVGKLPSAVLVDSATMAMAYDSVQVTRQSFFAEATLKADTACSVYRTTSSTALSSFTSRFALVSPYLVLSTASLATTDTLYLCQ